MYIQKANEDGYCAKGGSLEELKEDILIKSGGALNSLRAGEGAVLSEAPWENRFGASYILTEPWPTLAKWGA